MKLDRNINPDGIGKYALVLMRKLLAITRSCDYTASSSVSALHERGVVDYGDSPETEFFVIRIKDKYAFDALHAYAESARQDDPEYAAEVESLATKARNYHNKRKPD